MNTEPDYYNPIAEEYGDEYLYHNFNDGDDEDYYSPDMAYEDRYDIGYEPEWEY